MVDHVKLDDVVEYVLSNKTEFSIDGGGGTFKERPGFGFEFR